MQDFFHLQYVYALSEEILHQLVTLGQTMKHNKEWSYNGINHLYIYQLVQDVFHPQYIYDAKFSAISIKVENIYFRKKIGIKNRKKEDAKTHLTQDYKALPNIFSFLFFPMFFLFAFLGPIFSYF